MVSTNGLAIVSILSLFIVDIKWIVRSFTFLTSEQSQPAKNGDLSSMPLEVHAVA